MAPDEATGPFDESKFLALPDIRGAAQAPLRLSYVCETGDSKLLNEVGRGSRPQSRHCANDVGIQGRGIGGRSN